MIALLDADHIGHSIATPWFKSEVAYGWASCPLYRNWHRPHHGESGVSEPDHHVAILERLAMAKATERHRFWPDDESLTDATIFNPADLLGPKQITDRYLLALAVRQGGRYVMLDQAIRPTGVKAQPIVSSFG